MPTRHPTPTGAAAHDSGHPSADPAAQHSAHHSAYWRQTLRLSRWLLLLWGVVTLAVAGWGQSLTIQVLGWPLGFWATAQGALVVFCGIVWYYAWAMNRLDRLHATPTRD